MQELKNHIKRNTTILKIKTKINFNNGILLKNTILTVNREVGCGWFGGGYRWFLDILRNGELVEILEQV